MVSFLSGESFRISIFFLRPIPLHHVISVCRSDPSVQYLNIRSLRSTQGQGEPVAQYFFKKSTIAFTARLEMMSLPLPESENSGQPQSIGHVVKKV